MAAKELSYEQALTLLEEARRNLETVRGAVLEDPLGSTERMHLLDVASGIAYLAEDVHEELGYTA
jgi:hypothetical protein